MLFQVIPKHSKIASLDSYRPFFVEYNCNTYCTI